MSDLIPSPVLLAILQNQINNAFDNSKFPIYKTIDDGLNIIKFREFYYVHSDINGDVVYTNVIIDATDGYYASAYNVTLETDEYPDVFFHGNYLSNTSGSKIYRFSSGIILDSSSETVQYKIVLATYNVKTAKVTFVEKVLP